MKIVQINITDSGSTGKIACDIASCLQQKDCASKLVVGYYNTGKHNAWSCQSKLALRLNQIKARLFDYEDKIVKRETKKIIKYLDDFNPDIIHLHNIHGYYINYKLLFKYIKNKEIKTIWTLHDCWAFTGHCAYFESVKCDKWKRGCGDCPNLKSYPNSWFFDRSNKLYKLKKETFCGVKDMTIVCPSRWLAELAKQSFLKDYDIKVINNGINLDNFKQTGGNAFDAIIDKSKKIILGVASPFGERKGYSDFIKLSKIIDNNNYQVVMVGVDNNQKEHLNSHGIVAICRTENQKQLAELYSMAYCFVNLAYEDNYPTVNIEALACGCPIITYNTGGSVETVTAQNGAVVAQGDINGVYETLQNLPMFDRDIIAKDAIKLYNSNIMAEKYYNLYKTKEKNI